MELRDYLRILRRRWMLIATLTLLVVGAAAAWTFTSTPQYQSTARVFVSTTSSNSGESVGDAFTGAQFSQQRVTSYADLVGKSRELADVVIDDLDAAMTTGELLEAVEATVVPETVIIDLSVTDPSPAMAQALTQAYATALSDLIRQLETPPGASEPLIRASPSSRWHRATYWTSARTSAPSPAGCISVFPARSWPAWKPTVRTSPACGPTWEPLPG